MSTEEDALLRKLNRALGEAYIETGTQHLDLTMVIKGKQKLKEVEDAERAMKAAEPKDQE